MAQRNFSREPGRARSIRSAVCRDGLGEVGRCGHREFGNDGLLHSVGAAHGVVVAGAQRSSRCPANPAVLAVDDDAARRSLVSELRGGGNAGALGALRDAT